MKLPPASIPTKGKIVKNAKRQPDVAFLWGTMKAKDITGVWIADAIFKLCGRRYSPEAITRTLHGERRNEEVQKLIARVLGLPLEKAFPKTKTKIREKTERSRN